MQIRKYKNKKIRKYDVHFHISKLLYFFLFFSLLIITPSCSLSQRIKKANNQYEMGEYSKAGTSYRKIYPNIPNKNKNLRGEVAYKMGNCYRLINDNVRAETAYKNAVRYKFDSDSCLWLYYAEVQRRTGKYREARNNYLRYLELAPESDWAKNGVESCDSAQIWKKQPTQYTVVKDNVMNSPRRGVDFSPAVADADGSVIYFTSSRTNNATGKKNSNITGVRNNDIFMVKKDLKGKWDKPTPLPFEINSEFDEGACSLSPDGRTMYFTQCRTTKGETLGAEIYASQRAGGEWTAAKKIVLVQDSSVSVAHPAMSPDGEYLYYVSDMPGGFGGKDIWRSKKISDSEWDIPENLGNSINTAGDEMFPAFGSDRAFYFSSNGLPGFGGLDIFRATLLSKPGEPLLWQTENMLTPINSESDDFGISFIGKENKGYLSSNRKEPRGYDKIYRFEVPVLAFALEGKVRDYNNELISDAVVRIVGDDGTNIKIRVKKDGSYRFQLERDVNYVMQASARGFLNEKGNLSTHNLRKTQSFKQDFRLPAAGKPIPIDNIFYEFGRYTLTPSSEDALMGTVKMLEDNPTITVEIGAHTDMVGTEESNQILSTRRAESVVNFLIKQGIAADRLMARGYGESKPVVVDAALAEKYAFLNEGDVLNEEFINKLPEKDREAVNQINRRTEFVVLKTTYKMK